MMRNKAPILYNSIELDEKGMSDRIFIRQKRLQTTRYSKFRTHKVGYHKAISKGVPLSQKIIENFDTLDDI